MEVKPIIEQKVLVADSLLLKTSLRESVMKSRIGKLEQISQISTLRWFSHTGNKVTLKVNQTKSKQPRKSHGLLLYYIHFD